jgi:hypothetical protein
VALLQPIYDRFTEGFDTADLKTAKALLGTLQSGRRGARFLSLDAPAEDRSARWRPSRRRRRMIPISPCATDRDPKIAAFAC